MSDTFDHMNDAWDRHLNGDCDNYRYYSRGSTFKYNPYYYHTRLSYKSYKVLSDKCYRFLLENGHEVNIPKKVVKFDGDLCYVHDKFYQEFVLKVVMKKNKLVNAGTPRDIKMIPWNEAQFYL